MTEKNYTHKIVMYDVNGKVRTALFCAKTPPELILRAVCNDEYRMIKDDAGSIFNIANIVQINPVEVIE